MAKILKVQQTEFTHEILKMRKILNTYDFPNFWAARPPNTLFCLILSTYIQYLGGFGGACKEMERRKYILTIVAPTTII